MSQHSRRNFLKQAGLATTAAVALTASAAAAENEKLVVGLIGPGGMGTGHLKLLSQNPEVELAWVCDVDQQRLDKAIETAESLSGKKPKATRDLRNILDDQRVDAVFIATPDHWHGPAAIMALDAGKHVYVEKPCCHNIKEGRLMIEAVQRSGKQLQVGTQSRSSPTVTAGVEKVLGGEIGDVIAVKAWNSQRRGSIGHQTPSEPPAHLDFDTWLGAAPERPYQSNLLHGIWRWWYDFGCGDIGNDGVHDIDVALWGFGATTHPTSATCLGGKYFFDDDQQYPDTQYAVFEYAAEGSPTGKPRQFVFEQRIWSPYVQEGYENGSAWYGTQGMLIMGHTQGWRLYGPRNKLIEERTGGVDVGLHHQNFFDSIRGKATPNASIEVGHRAATIVHLANIAARTRGVLEFDPVTEQITNNEVANALIQRTYRDHWATPKLG
ncbi:MAG: Gfo/Idh/MocA family oxidoreductase [Planctomycetaceae bacterium]